MVDLQKKRRDGVSPGLIAVITLIIAVVIGGGYMGYRLTRYWMTETIAKESLSVTGMAFTREQAMARVSVQEPGASLFDWTDQGTSASGLTCSVMNRGTMLTGRAWTVCGKGDRIVRISVGRRQGTLEPRSAEAAELMRRLVEVVAPEASAAEKDATFSQLHYYWGNKSRLDLARVSISFSTDTEGKLTRITAKPLD